MRIGVGLSLGDGYGGTPSPSPTPTTYDASLVPPTVTLNAGATDFATTPRFYLDWFGDTAPQAGDVVYAEWDDDIRFGSITGSATATVVNPATPLNFGLPGSNVYYYRFWLTRGIFFGDKTNGVLHGAAADSTPSAFTFTDQSGVALSTVVTSAAVQLTGFNQAVAISITSGEYATSPDGVTYSAFTSSAGTVYPNDYVKARNTSSGSNSTAVNTVVTVGGVSDTFTSTTLAATVSLPTSGLLLQLDADDSSTLFQTTTGTTAVADGDPVGTWNDKSGGAFHLTAAAIDGTRPTYRTNSGVPYVEFDGVDDILRRLAKLGMYDAGALTIAIALRYTGGSTAPANSQRLIAERNSASANATYAPMETAISTAGANTFIRNDANTSISLSGLPVIVTAFNNTDKVLIWTDNGSSILGYSDGTAGTARTYTRSGVLTLNRFAIGAGLQSAAGNWVPVRIHALAVWNRVLNSTERADALTYMGAKQGRLL